MIEDAELLRRYVEEGSEEAFAELVQRHLSLVYFGALRRTAGDAHLAADVSQSVFIQLARHAQSLRHHPVLNAWLFTTTRNIAINARIAEERRRKREQEAFTMHESSSGQDQTADWDRLHPLLLDALDDLADQDRAAVLLRFFSGRPFGEVGRALRVTEEAARKRVDRALDKMHTTLARRGVTSTTAALAVALANQASAAVPAGLATIVTEAAFAGVASGGGIATGVFTFMSTSKITGGVVGIAVALCLSLLGNAYLLLQPAPSQTTTAAQTVPPSAVATKPLTPQDLVKSADLAALRDQMRSTGTDEATIRAVLEEILRRRYREKLSADRAERESRGWWLDVQRTWGTAAAPQRLADDAWLIRRMVTESLTKLIGADPLEIASADARYAFLPPELRQAFGQLDRATPAPWSDLSATGRSEIDAQFKAETGEQARSIEEQRKELIASLTPEQRAEYDMRFSSFATNLQQQLLPTTLTQQEYLAVYPIAEAYANASAALSTADKRSEVKNELDRQTAGELIAVFGYDRALDLIWARTMEYPAYERVAREAKLPASTAGHVLQLAAETSDQAAAVHADATLTVEQKRAALLALQQKVQPRLDALLPPEAQQRLEQDSLAWISQLAAGRYKPIATMLPGQNGMFFVSTQAVEAPVPTFRPSANLVPLHPAKE